MILDLVAEGLVEAVITPALFLEYEERLRGDPELQTLGVTDNDLTAFLDELAAKSYRTPVNVRWRPVSPDPDDDMVIECAVNGGAEVIVTFNIRDLRPASDLFGIIVLTPREFLSRFGSRR